VLELGLLFVGHILAPADGAITGERDNRGQALEARRGKRQRLQRGAINAHRELCEHTRQVSQRSNPR
jgi:hypothetical protein